MVYRAGSFNIFFAVLGQVIQVKNKYFALLEIFGIFINSVLTLPL